VQQSSGHKICPHSSQDLPAGQPDLQRGAQINYSLRPFVFLGLGRHPRPSSDRAFEYYIIPSLEMSRQIACEHELWLKAPGRAGQPHNDSGIRTVYLPPR
jgi:hypothetical protein